MVFSPARALASSRFGSLAQAATWFRALGDETRLPIIDRLSDGEECVRDLTDLPAMKQSLLSFHLKTLKDANIINDRRDGRWVYYSVNPDALELQEQFARTVKARSRK